MRWPFALSGAECPGLDEARSGLVQVRAGDTRPRVLIGLLGADQEDSGRALRLIARYRRVRTVIVVTGGEIGQFGRAGAVVEHLPATEDVLAHRVPGDWAAYLRQRWGRILAKWQPVSVLHEGRNFEDYISACALAPTVPAAETRGMTW